MNKRSRFWILLLPLIAIAVVSFGRAHTARATFATPMPIEAKPIYDSKCASCHGKDGRAKSLHAKHVHARDLTDAGWQNDVSDERIFNSISNGKGKMPAFKTKLPEDQIDALVRYVRQFKK